MHIGGSPWRLWRRIGVPTTERRLLSSRRTGDLALHPFGAVSAIAWSLRLHLIFSTSWPIPSKTLQLHILKPFLGFFRPFRSTLVPLYCIMARKTRDLVNRSLFKTSRSRLMSMLLFTSFRSARSFLNASVQLWSSEIFDNRDEWVNWASRHSSS